MFQPQISNEHSSIPFGAFLTKDMPVYVNNVDGIPIVPESRAGYAPYAASLIWSKAGYESERLFANNRMSIMKFLWAKGEVGQNDEDLLFYKTELQQWREFKEEYERDPNVQQFYGGYFYNSQRCKMKPGHKSGLSGLLWLWSSKSI